MGTKLILPFHQTTDVSFKQPLETYIQKEYEDRKASCEQDIHELNQMRKRAVNATDAHVANLKKIQSYISQLFWLKDRLPIDIGVEFPWYPTLGYHASQVESKIDLNYELVNMIYNLAALYSNLAMHCNGAEDVHKAAAGYFQSAAGTIKFLKTNVISVYNPPVPSDLDVESLECLETLMLAQAQDFFWQKAVNNKYKDMTISKIAAHISDLYATAAEHGTRSDGIKSEWIHHMKARHLHFMGIAQYRAACDALNKGRYGEEVSRLTESVNYTIEASKQARYVNQDVINGIYALKSKAQEDLIRATNDNDRIYLQHVPSKFELQAIERAPMVQSRVPAELSSPIAQLSPQGSFGQKLFLHLPPAAVRIAKAEYEKQKQDKVVGAIITKLEDLSRRMNDLVQALAIQESLEVMDKPLDLPDSLLSHAEEIKQRNVPKLFYDLLQDQGATRNKCVQQYDQALDGLLAENAEDGNSRRKFGTDKWSRQTSEQAKPSLFQDAKKIQSWLDQSGSSDKLISNTVKENERLFNILAGGEQAIREFVPQSTRYTAPASVIVAANKLRHGMNDIHRIEAERNQIIAALKSKMDNDNIESDLIHEAEKLERDREDGTIGDNDLIRNFSSRLQKYNEDAKAVVEQDRKQEQLMKRIQDSNAEFTNARKLDSSTAKRDEILKSLTKTYYAYKEISSHLAGAKRFYHDLMKSITAFSRECSIFVNARRDESSQIISGFAPDITSLNMNTAASLTKQKKEDAKNSFRKTIATTDEPITAPQPTRVSSATNMWNPSTGIRFDQNVSRDNNPDASNAKPTNWDPQKPIRFG